MNFFFFHYFSADENSSYIVASNSVFSVLRYDYNVSGAYLNNIYSIPFRTVESDFNIMLCFSFVLFVIIYLLPGMVVTNVAIILNLNCRFCSSSKT